MTQVKDVVVRLEALDGVWEVGGVDRKRGIVPENVSATADDWGPSEASFQLHRDPAALWPDLGAYTPVEIEIGGVKVWAGRVSDTPSTDGADRVMSINCKGWQVQLDDDQYERVYVHNKLSDWRDYRTFLKANLTGFPTSGVVQSDKAIVFGFPNGGIVPTGGAAGVLLDLGPSSTAKRIVVNFENHGVVAGFYSLYARGIDDPANIFVAGATDDAFVVDPGSAASPQAGTFATARRYLALFLHHPGAGGTETGDRLVRITNVQVFADTSYESANQSALTSPTLIKDALNRATVLLSSDLSQIDPTAQATTALPAFAPTDPQTPRGVWAAANALYDWISQIDVDRRPVFKPKPTSPIFEVGQWSPFELGDTSQNNGDDIYNQVIVVGQTPDGTPFRLTRMASQQPNPPLRALSTPSLANPSFDVDASGWTNIIRDTSTFDSSPASGIVNNTAVAAFTGTFVAGTSYVLQFAAKGAGAICGVTFGDTASGDTGLQVIAFTGSWAIYQVAWTPTQSRTAASVTISNPLSLLNVDSFKLFQAVPTLVDRRSFQRTKQLPIQIPLPPDGVLATKIADTWLAGHKLIPFRGDTTIVGDQAVRSILTGADIPLERLLLQTGQLLRFNDRIDPDTGGQGRDGRLVKVVYDVDKGEAKLTIDNTRTSFEALLNRLAAVITG